MYSKIVVIVSLPALLFFIWMSKPIMNLWVGPDFSTSAVMMSILMVPLLFTMPAAAAGCLFNAYAKVKIPSFVSVVSVVLQLTLGVLLAKFFAMGLVGISIAEAGVALAVSVLFSSYYAGRVSGLSLKEYWTRAYLPPFFWGCLMTGIGLYRLLFGSALTVNAMVVLILIFWGLIYCMGAYVLTMNSEEKYNLRALAQSAFSWPGTRL
jgi:O-antigen/teichoic acid export membrane protein